jgi:hypothetical protein
MSDRIPCINLACRRTAPIERYEPGTEIICGKCFRALPKAMRDRRRRLEGRERRVLRRIEKRVAQGTIGQDVIDRLQTAFSRRHEGQWRAIKRYLNAPLKPVGLDAHLEELGLA